MTTPKTAEGYTREGFLRLLHERLAAAHLCGLDREGFPASSLKLLEHYFDQLVAAPAAPSASVGGEPSDAQIQALAEALGLWCEAYTAPRECGVPTELDISPEHAAEFNAASVTDLRAALKTAGITHPIADQEVAMRGALEALKLALSALSEMHHAKTNPNWFTKGETGAANHFYSWFRRGCDAVVPAIASLESALKEKP